MIGARFVARWIDILDTLVIDAEPELSNLDAASSDADHGRDVTRATRL